MGNATEIPAEYVIAQTSGWSINHRINSALPGYLMIASLQNTNDLSDLPADTLANMGRVFASVQSALMGLGARRVYIARYGHSPGYPIHFHAIPIYDWVEELFWRDVRYRALGQFSDGHAETLTDGAELTFFVWREFCERADPPAIEGPSVSETIRILMDAIKLQ